MENINLENLPKLFQNFVNDFNKFRHEFDEKFNNIEQTNKIEAPISISEAAEFINLKKETIYTKVSKNEIPYHKNGHFLYFFKSELIQWIKEGKTISKESDPSELLK